MRKSLQGIVLAIGLIWTLAAHAQTLSGPYSVGPGFSYTNLTDVAAALKTNILTGDVVFEIQTNYTSFTEVFPIEFKQTTTSGGNWKVTIRPAAGANIITEGNPGPNNALITLDSTDRLILDGRAGGGPGGIAWTIRNMCAAIGPVSPSVPVVATSAGPVIRFLNDATYNTLTYLQLEGMNPVQESAIVFFGGTTGTLGNSYNGINYCNIRDRSDTTAGTATPAAGIISSGGPVYNNYNTINNNHIYNYFYPSSQTHGIRVNNAAGWVIKNNRFFQEQPRVFSINNNHKVIRIDNGAGVSTCTNHVIEGNIIGYSSADGTGVYDVSGLSTVLSVMDLNLAQSGNNIVSKNIITNILVNTASTANTGAPAGVFAGISTNQGFFTIDSNIIGSKTDTSSIRVLSTGAGFGVYGIAILNKSATVTNNYIGGITLENPSPGALRGLFYGISSVASGGLVTIANNQIGNPDLPFSIINRTGQSNTLTAHTTIGIHFTNSLTTVTNNTICNMVYQGGSTVAQVIGINSTGTTGAQKIGSAVEGSGNTIFRLFSNAPNIGTGLSASVIGIVSTNTINSQLVSQNRIHSLINTNGTAATSVTGMHFAGNATIGNDVINRNFIHSLSVESSNTSASIVGLSTGTASATFKNNIISLGLDTNGNDINTGYAITGINNTPTGAGTDSYFHNTVYIGGINVISGSNTYAFNRNSVTNTTNIMNNVFVNARSNASGTAMNIVLRNNSATNGGLNSNYNVYHRNGTGGKLFEANNSVTFDSLSNWQRFNNPMALDLNSGVIDPQLNTPAGSLATINMAPLATNPLEGKGSAATGVTDDYNGNQRSSATPNDIGAFSGNYTSSGDGFAPVITFTRVPGSDDGLVNRIISGVSITDNAGVASAANAPRLFYKKKTDANQFIGNFGGFDGWKYVVASNTTSPYSFTMDYALLSSPPVPNDSIVYFIAAQDINDNLVSSPGGAGYSFASPIQSIDAAPSNGLYIFGIGYGTISGNKTICNSGCDFSSLTGVNGLFHSMDTLAVTGNITATIITDIVEDGAYALRYVGTHQLTIVPDGLPRTISNSANLPANTPMIHFAGGSNITINGGASRNLIFKNTNLLPANTSATIQFSTNSANDTVRNCIIQNNGTSTDRASIVIAGANNVVIMDNKITDTSNASLAQPMIAILSSSASNNNLSILNNEISNFGLNGISVSAFGSNCTISGNHLFNNMTTVPTTNFTGINIAAGNGMLIDSNYIGGKAPQLGGGVWAFNSNTVSFGIGYSSTGTSLIQRNHIGQIEGTIPAVVIGINANGSRNPLLIKDNHIHDITSAGTNGALFISLGGIVYSSTNQNNVISGNTIYNLKTASTNPTSSPGVSGIGTNGGSSFMAGGEISGNRIYGFTMDPTATNTPDFRGIGPIQGNSTSMNLTIANNFISLGDGISNNAQIEGVWINAVGASVVNVYHNSIYIGGSVSPSSTLGTAAILKSNSPIGSIRNNILYNMRVKSSGGAGNHTAITNSTATPGNAWNSNYNLLYTSDTTSAAVIWGGTSTLGFSAWKNLANEPNTKSKTVSFNTPATANLHLAGSSIGDMDLRGVPLNAVSKDYDDEIRSTSAPYMGADEVPGSPLPVSLIRFAATPFQKDVILDWSTAAELNARAFTVEVSVDGSVFKTIGTVRAKGNSQAPTSYQFKHTNAQAALNNAAVAYYRLTSTDNDGSKQLSKVVSVQFGNKVSAMEFISLHPNPFAGNLNLTVPSASDAQLVIALYDLQGRLMHNHSYTLVAGMNTVTLEGVQHLQPGIYFAKAILNGEQKTLRVVKQ